MVLLDLNSEFQNIFEIDHFDHEDAVARTAHMPNAYFNKIVSTIEPSGALELFQGWDQQRRKSHAGRTANVSSLAVLTLFLLNAIWGLNYTHVEMARTIQSRLTPDQSERIGWQRWNSPVWAATMRLRNLIDPDHQIRFKKKTTGAAFSRAQDLRDADREPLGHQLAELLVAASIKMLPEHLRAGYRGDAAIDGTAVPIGGALNRNNKRCSERRPHELGLSMRLLHPPSRKPRRDLVDQQLRLPAPRAWARWCLCLCGRWRSPKSMSVCATNQGAAAPCAGQTDIDFGWVGVGE